jgi:hypothetical protein
MDTAIVEARQKRVEWLRRPPRLLAAVHQADVGGDPIQPRPEPRLVAERTKMTIRLQERLLQQIRRIGLTRQPAGKPVYAVLVAHDQRFKGMVVPGRGIRRERLVARLNGTGHARRLYCVLIAACTLAASSGVISVTPCCCDACVATCSTSSSSVAALAVKVQPGTTSAQQMNLNCEFCSGISKLLR